MLHHLATALVLLTVDPPIPPPTDTYIEFDFSRLPLKSPIYPHSLGVRFEVASVDGRRYTDAFGYVEAWTLGDIVRGMPPRMAQFGIWSQLRDKGRILRVYARAGTDGKFAPMAYGDVFTRGLTVNQQPTITNPLPRPVEVDFGHVPINPGKPVNLTFEVTEVNGETIKAELAFDTFATRTALVKQVATALRRKQLQVTVEGETVRVAGWTGQDGRFRRAARGVTRSAQLQANQLPTVRNPVLRPPAPVVFDFSPCLRGDQPAKLVYEITSAAGGATFRVPINYVNGLTGPESMATMLHWHLVEAGWYAERDGHEVRVFGWADERTRLHPALKGLVESRDLKPEQLPKITNRTRAP